MDIVFASGEASVLQIQDHLPEAPSGMAIRRMLSILEEKGHLKRRQEGREFPKRLSGGVIGAVTKEVRGAARLAETGPSLSSPASQDANDREAEARSKDKAVQGF